jgi:hypothetical protein
MTKQKNLKKLARARAATAGVSYAEARQQVAPTTPKKFAYPERVCSLDLETEETDFKDKAKSKVAIAGIKLYRFHPEENCYIPGKYKCFRKEQLSELGAFLSSFDGIILGHNIFAFDFLVLRSHFSLQGIIEKSVDTLAFLCRKNDNVVTGLSLDYLSMVNFGTGKTIQGKKVSEMWRQGKHKEVIRYNENDCDLAQDLWWQLVSEKQVYTEGTEDGPAGEIEVTKKDLPELLGEQPRFTYEKWEEKAASGEAMIPIFFRKREPLGSFPDFDAGDFFGQEFGHVQNYCSDCNKTMLYETIIIRGCSSDETITCPSCNKELGVVRCDEGLPVLLGVVDGDQGESVSQGMVPLAFEQVLRERAQQTLSQVSWEDTQEPLEERCSLCHRPPHPHYELYDNPADDSPICMECLTACRWILSMK